MLNRSKVIIFFKKRLLNETRAKYLDCSQIWGYINPVHRVEVMLILQYQCNDEEKKDKT